jgi:hypothetical protein
MSEMKDMDLRDWFAGQALNALIVKRRVAALPDSPFHKYQHVHTAVHEAYVFADEMMRERSNDPQRRPA